MLAGKYVYMCVCVRACVFHFMAQITFTVTDGIAETMSYLL